MRAHRHAVAALLAVCWLLVGGAHADPLPAGSYPGYLIINPDGSQEIRVNTALPTTMYQVTISQTGSGASNGITTGSGTYPSGTTVTLTATPGANTIFAGWSGDAACSATPFAIASDLRCIATFTTTPAVTLTIAHAGTGTGVTSPVVGTTTVAENDAIVLTATPDSGSTFSSWDPHPCAASFAMPAQSLTCTASFTQTPASSYTLTLNTVGSGTVTGAGTYLAGVAATVTAVPAAGSSFTAWSGGGACPTGSATPTTVTMPAANTTCVATFTALPPPTGVGTWTLLSTGTAADPQPVSGGFQPWAYNYLTGDLWFYSSAQAGKVYRFSHSTMRWTVTANGNVGSAIHNCGLAFVGDNDAMYMGGCAPDGGQGGSWVISTAAGTLGVMTYQPSDVFGRSTDPLCVYERAAGVLLCLGGWSNTTSLVEKDVTPFAGLGSWTTKNPTGTKPALGPGDTGSIDSFTKTSYNRGGYNVTTGKLWVIDIAGDLFLYTRSTNSWAKTTMSGTKPPSATVYAYHEPSNIIVGVAACVMDGNAVCQGGGQTYLGAVGTASWSLGPGPAQGPPKNQYWGQNIVYNEARQTIQLISHASGLPPLAEFTPSTTPPAPGVDRVFTVAKTGSGDGTVGGGGTYADGTVVTATAVPNSASQFDGWVESYCPTFTISADVPCTAKLNIKVSVPVGPYPDLTTLATRTFVPVECGPKNATGAAIYDLSPWPCGGGSKHQRWAADGLGSVWTGFGDTSPSNHAGNPSQGQGYKLRLSDGQWTRWNPACRPAGQLQPSYPDEVIWAYDARGYFWLLGGVTQGTDGAICNSGGGESGSTLYKTGLMKYTVSTDRWERFTGVNGTNGLWGHFDNTNKHVMYMGNGGTGACGTAFFKVNVDSLVTTSFNLCLSSNPFPGVGSTFENYPDLRDTAWAWDGTGRIAYILAYHQQFVAGSPVDPDRTLRLWAVNVDTGAVTQKAVPPHSVQAGHRTPDMQDVVFDTVNRRVLVPAASNHCGVLTGMYSYDPVTNTWESHSITPSATVPGGFVRGNSAVYDPENNVMVVGGSVACTEWGFPGVGAISHWFLWRYGP